MGRRTSPMTSAAVDGHHPAADLAQTRDRGQHVVVVHADHEEVVVVVGDRGGHRAALQAEALDEADADRARPAVALDARCLGEVDRRIGRHRAVDHRRLHDPVLGGQLAGDHADRAHLHPFAAGSDAQVVDGRRARDADRVPGAGRVLVGRRLAADRLTVGQHEVRAHLRQVLHEQDVRAAAGGDRADVVAAAHVLGRVDRRHLDRDQRVDPGGDRRPHGVVEVAHGGERLGMHVVGDEQRVARVDAVLQQHRGELLDVVPRRALAQLDPHPGAQLGQGVAAQHGLVVGVHAGRDVGVQAMVVPAVQAPVPGHRQPRVEHGADHLVGRRVGLDDAGHVHHLPQAGDALPAQRLADVVGRDRRPGILEAGQRRHAGRDRQQHLELEAAALLEHPTDAVEPEDVGDLVIVDEHRRGAVRQDRLGEARDGHHRRLDVHVRVDEPGHEMGTVGVEHARLRSRACGRRRRTSRSVPT